MPEKEKPTEKVDFEKALDAQAIAKLVKECIEKDLPGVLTESLKPFIEKDAQYKEYSTQLIDLARMQVELRQIQPKKGLTFARMARAIALGKGDPDRIRAEVAKHWGADDYILKALTSTNTSAMIPQAVSAEFIEMLRAQSIMRQIARIIPMPAGNLTFKKGLTGATSYYVGESSNVTPSQGTVGTVNLSAKKLVTLTPISNTLLRFGGQPVDEWVLNELLAAQADREDKAFFSDAGTENTPKGIYSQINSTHIFADAGTSFANQIADYTKCIKLVEEANILIAADGHWIMTPRVFWGIYKTTGSTEDATMPFAPGLSMATPMLVGYRVWKTTHAKYQGTGTDLTTSTDRVYFLNGANILLGESYGVTVDAFDGGSYYDGSAVVSGVSRDESVIRAISEHDLAVRHDKAGAIITGCSIGA